MEVSIRLDKKQLREMIVNLLLNLVGSALLAFGLCAFVEPFGLVVGGASGIALVTHRLTGIRMSLVTLLINLGVLIPGYILGGRKLVVGSIISSAVVPAALAIFEQIPGITMIADNTMLATICGGAVCGAGIGLVMRSGGSTGGMDIASILIAGYFHQPVDRIMNGIDVIIMAAQVPFSAIRCVLYGMIFTFLMARSLGSVLTFGAERLKMNIISERYEDLCVAMTGADFGVTLTAAEGGYTRTPIKKIESVMPSGQYRRALQLIDSTDPEAFVTVENVKDVRGRGYTLQREYITMD